MRLAVTCYMAMQAAATEAVAENRRTQARLKDSEQVSHTADGVHICRLLHSLNRWECSHLCAQVFSWQGVI